MFFRKQSPQILSQWTTKNDKEKHLYFYNNDNKTTNTNTATTHNNVLRNTLLFLCTFLFAWLLVLLLLFPPAKKTTLITENDTNSDRVRISISSCKANYSVYVYDLPIEFNSGLLQDCRTLNVYTDMCPHVANRGLGRPISALDPTADPLRPAWFATHQFIAEMIFHARVENHPCRTLDPSRASLFYVPFYGGLHASSKFRESNLTARDDLAVRLTTFLSHQPWFPRRHGVDHFIALGRTAWDFMRSDDPAAADFGANRLLNLPAVVNMTVMTVERNPWKGYNQFGIPYASYFHPSTWREVSTWQNRVRRSHRPNLFSFIGGARKGLEKAAIRDELIRQCRGSTRCELMDCGGPGHACHDPAQVIAVMGRSDFCLQAPGDSFTRRSTFDAVLAGCVPVFFSEHTAYSQYGWFLPAERDEWSVFLPEKMSRGGATIEEALSAIPKEKVAMMRERVVEMIPRLTYAHPNATADKGFDDAVDVALSSLADHVRPGHL